MTCTNGLLAFMCDDRSDAAFVECLECMTTYTLVAGGGLGIVGWANDVPGSRFATMDEVARAGWTESVLRELPDR